MILLYLVGGAAAWATDFAEAARPGHLLILTEPGVSPTITSLFPEKSFTEMKALQEWEITAISSKYNLKSNPDRSASESPLDNLYILSFPQDTDTRGILAQLKRNPTIRYAEPDYALELFTRPVDSFFAQQWYFYNEGQEFYAVEKNQGPFNDVLYLKTGLAGEDINLRPIYDNPPADSVDVIVAIIDTGIDYDHPDLAENIFIHPFEIPGNGLDDDHNGLVDDYRGWDFSGDTINVIGPEGDSDATDSIGHGTHVAGLVAAVENEIGIAGYPGKIKILPIKIFPNGFVSLAVAAIIYAADMDARVINMSWGFPFESQILIEAVRYAESRGVLSVAAAGNFGDSRRVSPASIPESFTVGGTNSDGFMTYFSSFGPSLDIVAPGRNILSLRAAGTDLYAPAEEGLYLIADQYILADGTSMSAPLVAGAAAMLRSFNPGLDLPTLKDALRQSADDLTDPFDQGDNLIGYDTLSGWGRLNIGRAFDLIRAPSAYLTAPLDGTVVSGGVTVGMAVTGGYSGRAALYLGEGPDPEEWFLLYETETVSDNDSLYLWDSNGRNGYFVLRLVTDHGESRIDIRAVNDRLAAITSPQSDTQFTYLVPIHISASGPGYDSVAISIRPEAVPEYQTVFTGTRLYFDEFAYDWPIANLDEGYYYIKLTAHFGLDNLGDSTRIFVKSSMRPGFPISLPGFIAFSPGTADINGDGLKEIIIGCQKGLYAYDPEGSLLPGFPVMTDTDLRALPAFDDIDGDGLVDIIITGSNILTCFNYLGQQLPGWPREASSGLAYFAYPIPVATELYNRADSVILFLSKYGEVHAYNFNGDSYFYSLDGLFTALDPNLFDTSMYAGLSVPYVTAVDLDHDGNTEVVAVYSTSGEPSGIYIWNGRNGLPPFDWDSPLARSIRLSSGGVLADLDDDGYLETIMAGKDSLYSVGIWVTRNGREDIAGWPIILDGLSDWLGTAPVCADIDNNGLKEIVVAFYNYDAGRIYAFNADGTPYVDDPNRPYGLLVSTQTTLSNLVVADIDGNGLPNLICRGGYVFPGTGFERIYAWEPNGAATPGFPIITPTPPTEVVSTLFTPVIDDLDNDSILEMIICGDNNNLYVYNLDAHHDPDLMVWPRYRGDIRNSGINHNIGQPTGTDDTHEIVPDRLAVTGVYPNPFNPTATITFTLERSAEIRLEVFNILGQKVKSLIDGRHPAGVHRIEWDGRDETGREVASGVYFARLTDKRQSDALKMVLMR